MTPGIWKQMFTNNLEGVIGEQDTILYIQTTHTHIYAHICSFHECLEILWSSMIVQQYMKCGNKFNLPEHRSKGKDKRKK